MIKKISSCDYRINNKSHATITYAGDTVTLRAVQNHNEECPIEKIDNDTFVVRSTGEVKQYNHEKQGRLAHKGNLRKTFNKIRDLVNANVTVLNQSHVLFVTLTFAENMQNPLKAYEEFKKFMGRLKTYCIKHEYVVPKYISVIEPQARGAFHFHVLLIFPTEAPFIPNTDLEKIWSNGFTDVQRFHGNVSNVGLYLTAYMSDIVVDESGNEIIIDSKDKQKKSSIKKGARLHFYPKGLHIVRHSRDIEIPTEIATDYQTAMEQIKEIPSMTLDYETTVEIKDEATGFENVIQKKYYSLKYGKEALLAFKYKGKGERTNEIQEL
ncbi:MAG: hypothetical protein ACI4SN_02805 [Lachnospiraceae bacterium]